MVVRPSLIVRQCVAGFARLAAAGLCLCSAPAVANEPADWPDAESIPAFVAEMTSRHGFDATTLNAIFRPLKPNATVLRLIAPPTDPRVRSWQRYRARFVDEKRIAGGVRFWNEHAATVARAAASFGVPPEIIVAIIGVETEYGRNMGSFRVLEALATVAFAYPPRAAFFRGELEQLLLLARENHLAPETLLGSYAGAIGIPQFMPGSQRRYAIDFDEDGRVDLRHSADDAIGSVARFLSLHGWVSGRPIAERAATPPADPAPLIAAGIRPTLDAARLDEAGVAADARPATLPAALVELDTPDEPSEFWWVSENFYVITRYNRSNFYAMSVAELARAIAGRHADVSRPAVTKAKRQARPAKAARRLKTGYRAKLRRGG